MSQVQSKINYFIRNRKVHYAAFILLLFGITLHTIHGQGISIDYEKTGYKRVHNYRSTTDIINDNFVVADVRITRCMRGFRCSQPKEDVPNGYWERMPTKLNLFQDGFSLFNYYMYVAKAKGSLSGRFVVDISFTYSNKEPTTGMEGSKWALQRLYQEAYMWINYFDTPEFHIPIVRDINVLYGKQDLFDNRPHWKFESAAIILPVKQTIHCTISVLRIQINQESSILTAEQEFDLVLKKNGIFVTSDPIVKVIQISDLHINQGDGACFEKCKFDKGTLDFMRDAFDAESGNKLIVITGDMIDYMSSPHYESVILKAVAPILKAQIPFVFVFGNSDYDMMDYNTKLNVYNFIASLPGCYNQKISDLDHRMHGISNGNINIYQIPPLENNQSPDYNALDLTKPQAMITYLDSALIHIDDSQANYLYRLNHHHNEDVEQKLLFFHHPLPNFRPSGKVKLIGTYNEKHYLQTSTDRKILLDIKAAGYKVVGVGHEHENDACIWDEDDKDMILLCYSGVTGESAIRRLDSQYKRRLRVFQLDFEKNNILSWKRDPERQFDPQEIWSEPVNPIV